MRAAANLARLRLPVQLWAVSTSSPPGAQLRTERGEPCAAASPWVQRLTVGVRRISVLRRFCLRRSQRTGKIYWRSEFSDLDELNDELPDDVEEDENYVAIPDRRELGLGKPLVLDFAREFLPNDFDEVRYIFSKRGAYQKFRVLLTRRNALDRRYDFESKATEQALREWCKLNSIEVAG
jgi:hypothetical protein